MASVWRRALGCRCVGVFLQMQQRGFIINSISQSTSETASFTAADSDLSKERSFEELLESSQLMKIRRPVGRAVVGKITNICNDDLYVDFGGKFYTVVKKPAMNPE